MNLYHWDSKTLAAYSAGAIIVMAPDVEEARVKVYDMFKPLEDGNPFEDSHPQLLYMNRDEDYHEEYAKKMMELVYDLNKEPTILTSGVALIRGSD